jgi:hypothetical protein
MDLAAILSSSDADRASRTLAMLRRHRAESLVLTGGMAIELNMLLAKGAPAVRPLNDIDFVVDSFSEIPATLAADLIFRHVHPHDPPAKTLLQCVHAQHVRPETAVRVDIIRAYGGTTARGVRVQLNGASMRMVSLEDLAARTARLCMGLAADEAVPAKHARDLLRLLAVVDLEHIETAWQDHRKAGYPASFSHAARKLTALIAERPDLQIDPVYSRDTTARCSRCEATPAFPLADAGRVLSLLGYC